MTRTLKKRGAKDPNDKTHGITWETVLLFGVPDTPQNKARYLNNVLDLLAEAVENEAQEAPVTRFAQPIDRNFLDQQEQLKCKYCPRLFKTLSGLENHIKNKHQKEL